MLNKNHKKFLKDSIILKRYLLYLSKNKDIVSKITVLSVENIRKDIERIIEYEKEILRLKHQIANPHATLLLTNIEYKSQVNIDFDIRYLLYIKKYGCPEDGIFIDDLLNEIFLEIQFILYIINNMRIHYKK